MTYQRKVGRTL